MKKSRIIYIQTPDLWPPPPPPISESHMFNWIVTVVHVKMKLGDNTLNNKRLSHWLTRNLRQKIANCSPGFTAFQDINNLDPRSFTHVLKQIETTMRRNCISKSLRFLQITAENQDCPAFIVFLTVKTSSQNISIILLKIPLKLH